MHIFNVGKYLTSSIIIIIFFCTIRVENCMRMVPQETLGIPASSIHYEKSKLIGLSVSKIPSQILKTPTNILKPSNTNELFVKPVAAINNEFEKVSTKFIEETSSIVNKSQQLKELAAVFTGCYLNQINFNPPKGRNSGKVIIAPQLTCEKASIAGCQKARVTCVIPKNSKYPLISGFAKINGADWATTDLKASVAEFELDCDIYHRWTYISDIPGIKGKIFETSEIFCLLVPILTGSNHEDADDYY